MCPSILTIDEFITYITTNKVVGISKDFLSDGI